MRVEGLGLRVWGFLKGPCYKGAALHWGPEKGDPHLENYPYGGFQEKGTHIYIIHFSLNSKILIIRTPK